MSEVQPNTDTVLMSDVLKNQLSDDLSLPVQKPWVVLLERVINKGDIKPFTGFLVDISDDNNGRVKEVVVRTTIEDGMDTFRAHNLRNMNISFRHIELSRDIEGEEDVKFDVSNYVLSGCRIGNFDYVGNMCELLLKLTIPTS